MYNMYAAKTCSGLVSGAIGIFIGSLWPLFICVIVFECVDFVTGCWKSFVIARRKGENPAFESIKAWRTIYKVVFIFVCFVLSEMLDAMLSDSRLRLANFFTAFCCGVEFCSFLENAAEISEHPIFRWLKKFMKHKVENELGEKFDENV